MIENYTPHGEIEIFDVETGKVIQKTHNMIVESGRNLILQAMFDDKTTISLSNFKKFYEVSNDVSAENVLTTPTMVYSDIRGRIAKKNSSEEADLLAIDTNGTTTINTTSDIVPEDSTRGIIQNKDSDNTTITGYTYKDTIQKLSLDKDSENHVIAMHLHMKIENTNITTTPIVALGLLYGTSDSDYILFSRAVVDPVYVRDKKIYMVNYSIYF